MLPLGQMNDASGAYCQYSDKLYNYFTGSAYMHHNWGWYGTDNGYFTEANIQFNNGLMCILNIKPLRAPRPRQ